MDALSSYVVSLQNLFGRIQAFIFVVLIRLMVCLENSLHVLLVWVGYVLFFLSRFSAKIVLNEAYRVVLDVTPRTSGGSRNIIL